MVAPYRHVVVENKEGLSVTLGTDLPFVLVAGPCVIESRDHAFFMSENLKKKTSALGIPLIFKASFDKANRSSISGNRGVGVEEGLRILHDIGRTVGVLTTTDVHNEEQCALAAQYVDMLQIPALLCRQTDLLQAAALTHKPVNIKKGQFLAPWEMKNVPDKMKSFGNDQVILCERGTTFGYNRLVSDFRGLEIMADTGYPVMFDATHSVQLPGGLGHATAGERHFAPLLTRAALATGVASVFMEVHDNPNCALSDGPNMIPLAYMDHILPHMKALDTMTKEYRATCPKMEDIYAPK